MNKGYIIQFLNSSLDWVDNHPNRWFETLEEAEGCCHEEINKHPNSFYRIIYREEKELVKLGRY